MGKSFCIIPNLSKGEVHAMCQINLTIRLKTSWITSRLPVVIFHELCAKENVEGK